MLEYHILVFFQDQLDNELSKIFYTILYGILENYHYMV